MTWVRVVLVSDGREGGGGGTSETVWINKPRIPV